MTDLRKLLDEATPGPWWVCEYDAGDKPFYSHNGLCPSIQAPEEFDCAVVHWDGFKQQYWSSANGNQRQIDANARLIALAPSLAAALLKAEEVLERISENTEILGDLDLSLSEIRNESRAALSEIRKLTGEA